MQTNALNTTRPTLADESLSIARPGEGTLKIALVFPNTYYLGMSNLGFQLLYQALNRSPGVVCERVFLSDKKTVDHLLRTNRPIVSFESGTPLRSFHVIAFSLTFENDYINILTILNLAHIPFLRSQRSDVHPLLIAGGISVFLNPEPLADVFDLFIIGEAEEVIEEFLEHLKSGHPGKRWRKPPLEPFSSIDGVYLPSGYSLTYGSDGMVDKRTPHNGLPSKISCRHTVRLNTFPASSCITTPHTEFGNMTLVEVSRGCPHHCRFCAVGSVYRPYRLRKKTDITELIRGLPSDTRKIGLLGSAVSDHPDLLHLIRTVIDRNSAVSLSSLRAGAIRDELIAPLQHCGLKTVTLAPEAGSSRMRRAIRKNLSHEEIIAAVRVLSRHNIPDIKLYFLIGLPGETAEDIAAIIDLTKEIKHTYIQEARNEKRLHLISLSVNPFVPKPFTPFQWHPYEEVKVLKQKIKTIIQGLKKERKVAVHYSLPKWGYIQTLLSRGDRRVCGLLVRAFEQQGNWWQAFRQSPINPDFYVYRSRDKGENLPWDFIEHNRTKQELWSEYRNALDGLERDER